MTTLAHISRDFAAVRERDPAARGRFEVLFCYPGLHAVFVYRLANALWRRKLRFAARFLSYLARAFTGVDIHPGATIGSGFFIDHGAGVVIGETAEIGTDVTLYHGVTLGGVSWSPGKRHPTIGDRCMIGAGAKILGPVTVESAARVGANSVVVSDVPEGATVIGIPARIVQSEQPVSRDPMRINLDHHLMPDPVGRTLAQLADRIAFLEVRLAAERSKSPPRAANSAARPRPKDCAHQ